MSGEKEWPTRANLLAYASLANELAKAVIAGKEAVAYAIAADLLVLTAADDSFESEGAEARADLVRQVVDARTALKVRLRELRAKRGEA